VHGSEEAGLCAVLCHLSQDTSGPEGGLENLRKHDGSSVGGGDKELVLGRLSVY
jgi:hypothetical protein